VGTGFLTASCACGAARLEASGKPIIAVVCYCDDCQAAGKGIEALAGAAQEMEAPGRIGHQPLDRQLLQQRHVARL